MSDHSAIQWCDATWNCVTGCTKVSPGCAHCYIETTTPFRMKGRKFVQGAIPVQLHDERLYQPLRWRKPKRIFVNSLSDLFHPDVPDAFIDRVFAVMALCPQHTFQVLTKRAERMRAYFSDASRPDRIANVVGFGEIGNVPYEKSNAIANSILRVIPLGKSQQIARLWPLPNVWLGVSVENQHFADERIPLLLQTPAAIRFISAEPLLGPVDIEHYVGVLKSHEVELTGPWLDWVIVGGESGPAARPFDLAWARSIVEQCKAAGVACFVKQLGAQPYNGSGIYEHQALTALDYMDRKGGDPSEWPKDLRVRQFPEARA